MYLAATGVYCPKWTEKIHEEWMRNVLKDYPHIEPHKLERTKACMCEAQPDANVEGYEPLMPALNLPDEGDKHVLAAAIKCSADFIITFNLKDFPKDEMDRYSIVAIHPDDFLTHHLELKSELVCEAVRRDRAALSKPSRTPQEYIDALASRGLTSTADGLVKFINLI